MIIGPRITRLAVALATLLAAPRAVAAGLYAQIVLPFAHERTVTHTYVKKENALILAFQKTSPSELGPLDQYDERLIKRVVVKDLGPVGTEVKLILRDKKVRAIVNEFQEPFRVTVDLFDADYKETLDPQTGLPLAGDAAGASATQAGGLKLVTDDDAGGELAGAPLSTAHDAAGPAAASETAGPQTGKRRLLQPLPDLLTEADDLDSAMRKVPDGLGKAWKGYPPYVYRLHTAPYEAGLATERLPNPAQALSSAQAMADYAGKLYNLGHEQKALVAYQQVLLKDPSIFEKDALHLWKFSETQLAQGNLTLARGYYEAILEKHPESPIAQFAKIRLLDVQAIRLAREERTTEFPQLLSGLDAVKSRGTGEAAGLVAIRKAYWGDAQNVETGKADYIPKVATPVRNELTAAIQTAETPKTKFLASTIVLGDLVRPETPWVRSMGAFADSYFKNYKNNTADTYVARLKDELQAKLNKTLQAKVADGKLIEAIDDYEALPAALRSIKKTPATAWALAEAYRKLEQGEKGVELYQAAAKGAAAGPEKFKAEFWLAVTAGSVAERLKADKAGDDKTARYTQISKDADRNADAAWKKLQADEQRQISIAYKDAFEKAVTAPAKLRTPAKLVLASWTGALATRASAQNGDKNDWQAQFSPSGSTVILLTDLAKRLQELGLAPERRQAMNLLRQLKPSEFGDDKAAKEIWTKQLVTLAEDHRRASEYLDAGRIYAQVGEGSENWEGRAEALYKGGLLLYRAGRREEALESFRKASEDGNNLFYANLAKERLAQIEK